MLRNRLLALLLALALAMGGLTACGGEGGENGNVPSGDTENGGEGGEEGGEEGDD